SFALKSIFIECRRNRLWSPPRGRAFPPRRPAIIMRGTSVLFPKVNAPNGECYRRRRSFSVGTGRGGHCCQDSLDRPDRRLRARERSSPRAGYPGGTQRDTGGGRGVHTTRHVLKRSRTHISRPL